MRIKKENGSERLSTEVLSHLKAEGFRGKLVPAHYVGALKQDLEGHRQAGRLDEELHREYHLDFDFAPPDWFTDGSVFVVAMPQPQVRLSFTIAGRAFPVIVPPTYLHNIDDAVQDLIRRHLEPEGYRVFDFWLPSKLLAVRSGLARYGRNNITYVPGMGSFHRLRAFGTDLPACEADWGELQALDLCTHCRACVKACPTGAIHHDRFLIRAERCLTFHNERKLPFPDWVDPGIHSCLIGCMDCQLSCPENRNFKDWVVDGKVFTEGETRDLLQGKPKRELPAAMLEKLRRIYLLDELEAFSRNLAALLRQETGQAGILTAALESIRTISI